MKNTFIAWKAILNYGLIAGALFTIVILVSYLIEPLMWIGDLPKEAQEKIGEVPPDVLPMGWIFFLSTVAIFIVFPVLMNKKIFNQQPENASFWNFFLHALLLANFVNLVDLIIVDILIFDTIQPDFMMIEGAEEYIREYVNAGFHFIGFLKGQPWMLSFAAISAGISMAFRRKKVVH
ncbi:MAG: hypothetical protein AAF944_24515 [Bacteroidota bacterium]